jgi:hypothetical protein
VLKRDPNAHQFTLTNGLKDTTYVEKLAQSVGLANPVGNAVKNSFALAVGTGRGDLHVPMLSDIVAELNGTSLVRREIAPAHKKGPPGKAGRADQVSDC